jgi:diphthamide biosynthesis protein 2
MSRSNFLAQYLSIIANLKKLITAAGKKYYLLAVGQPSPQKLGNFPEIEAFVLVSCPQNALLDSREFMNPVITPYELKIALDPHAKWDLSEYELDVLKMNTEIEESIHNLQAIDSDEEPEFSLITGGFVPRKYTREKDFLPTDDALVKKSDATVSNITHTFASAAFLSKREFKGLEVQKGETEVTEIEQGRAGIARGYVNEAY